MDEKTKENVKSVGGFAASLCGSFVGSAIVKNLVPTSGPIGAVAVTVAGALIGGAVGKLCANEFVEQVDAIDDAINVFKTKMDEAKGSVA